MGNRYGRVKCLTTDVFSFVFFHYYIYPLTNNVETAPSFTFHSTFYVVVPFLTYALSPMYDNL